MADNQLIPAEPALPPAPKYDGEITIAVGASRKSVQWQNRTVLWSDLVKRLSVPQRTAETALEYKKFPKARRDDLKDVGGFVGGTLKGGRRKAEAILQRRLLTLDLDEVPKGEDPWPAVELVLGCAAVLYSTHSHTPANPRLRIVIPLSRAVSPEEYAALSRRIGADIGIDMCDDTTFEPHRLMYWPSLPYDGDYRFEVSDGPWLDPDEQLARYADWHDPSQWPVSSRREETMRRVAKKQGNPLEKEGVVGAFCRVYSIPDAIEHFLPEVYAPAGDDRFTYLGGTTTGGLVLYEQGLFAYSHHGTDPVSGRLCNAFDLVRIHLYGEQDDNATPGTPVSRLPSYGLMADTALEIPEVREELAKARLKDLLPAFDDDEDTTWTQQLTISKSGKFEPTINNVLVIMQHDPELRGRYYYDEFKDRMTVDGDLPWSKLADRQSTMWTDADDAGLRNYIELRYTIDSISKISDAVALAMTSQARHPVREYLDGLTWDGVPRADTIFIDYLGAEDDAYTRTVTRKALIGAVARIYQPGCKHDHILVLVGPQGSRKSTTLAKLGKSWFSDSLYTVQGKEAYEQLQGFWIIEMGEMAATRKAELEQIKQFISKQSDSYRAAYARRTKERPRQCAFFGSTNDDEFMRDTTGGRRFWPVTVTDAGRTRADSLTEDVIDQIWAEIVTRYRAGESWYLDDLKMENEARDRQDAHTEMNGKQGVVEEFLKRKIPANWDAWSLSDRLNFWAGGFEDDENAELVPRQTVCAAELWVECFHGTLKDFTQAHAREMNGILRRVPGWTAAFKVNCGSIYGRQRGFKRELQAGLNAGNDDF